MSAQKRTNLRKKEEVAPESAEWQARVDLAAAHRLAVIHGLERGHPQPYDLGGAGKLDRLLLIPFELHWSEVTASSFMEVSYDGQVLSGQGDVERTAFCIHAPIHRLNPKAAAVFHTNMPYSSALTRLSNPRIEAIGQTEILMMKHIAYDDDYHVVDDIGEGERLAGILGDKSILLMGNHGVLVTGETVAEAYDRLYYLERACQVQIYALCARISVVKSRRILKLQYAHRLRAHAKLAATGRGASRARDRRGCIRRMSLCGHSGCRRIGVGRERCRCGFQRRSGACAVLVEAMRGQAHAFAVSIPTPEERLAQALEIIACPRGLVAVTDPDDNPFSGVCWRPFGARLALLLQN
nr:class II aldolase/adducin family protein [Bradyrhizobium sp. CCBAU 21362]